MRQIALVGTAETGVDAPFNDPDYEIWGVSARAPYVTRATRWFELHRLDGEPREWVDNWRKVIKIFSHDCELIMFYPEDLGPKVTQYPIDRITARFGTYFMTSTFSWMIALAIDEMCPLDGKWEPGEIAIFGVDMEYGTEYRQQRVGLRHFIDLARVLGITITRLASGGLSYEPIPYPLWQDDPLINKLDQRTRANQQKLENMNVGIGSTRAMLAQNRAILDELGLMERCRWKDGRKLKERKLELEQEFDALMQVSSETSKSIVSMEGALEEQRWLRDYLSP